MMNTDKKRPYNKPYYQANKERIKAQSKAWRKANPEKVKAWRKTYEEKNREKIKARRKAYSKINCKKQRAQTKAWAQAHPDKKRERNRKVRILKHTTQTEPINEKEVYLRDGWICQICKKQVDKRFNHPNPMCASLDHITPLSEGGSHTYANVQLAYLVCNQTKYINVLPQGEQLRIF